MPTTCYCFVILYPTYYLLFDCLLFTIEETYQLSIVNSPLPFSDRFPSVLRQSVRLSFPIGRKPCGVRFEHIAGRYNAFLKAKWWRISGSR